MIESPEKMDDIDLAAHYNDLRVALSIALTMRLISIVHAEMVKVRAEIDRRKRIVAANEKQKALKNPETN